MFSEVITLTIVSVPKPKDAGKNIPAKPHSAAGIRGLRWNLILLEFDNFVEKSNDFINKKAIIEAINPVIKRPGNAVIKSNTISSNLNAGVTRSI